MKIETKFPYNDYVGYIVNNPKDRKKLCLVHKQTKQRTTVSYARYLMAVKEKRLLNSNEQVDHIDENRHNDVIENLQILTGFENSKKNRIARKLSRKWLLLECPGCKIVFEKLHNQSFITKKGLFNACSNTCKYNVLKKGLSIEELKLVGERQILKEFRV